MTGLWSKNEGTDKVLEGTAQEYESTAGANLSTAEVLNAHIRYHLKELRYCAQCLIIENEDFVKRSRDHYMEPIEFEIQEMVNIWVRDSARSEGPYELVHVKFEISSWRGARVGVRMYLLGGAIDGSKANGIIHDPKLELESSHFTFDLVPLSYESVDVVVGRELVVGHRLRWLCHESVFLGRKKGCVMDTLKFTAMPFGLTNAPAVFMELISRFTEGREYVREVFQQRRSGAKRKLSRCGRNQLGNEPILALPEGADDFVLYYDARSKDLEACLEKGRSEFDFEAKYHLGKANVDVVPWNRKKE
ncbi:hypothetical protein Tco_0919965 [Tanacetum coccineum]